MDEILFEKNRDLFDDRLSTGIIFTSATETTLVEAIFGGKSVKELPLPIQLLDGKVKANTDDGKFQFANDRDITINGKAQAKGGIRLGIYQSLAAAVKDLSDEEEIPFETTLSSTEEDIFVLFSVAYSLSGTADGSWLFGSGKVTANVSGSAFKRLAVIRQFKNDHTLLEVIKQTMGELRSPKSIEKVDDLAAGTLLLVQSDGSVNGAIGATVGYGFNWLYESSVEGLEGSAGLKAKLGAGLQVGYQYAGEFNLLLSRETNQEDLRLRIFKKKTNGWNFAASLSATLQGSLDENLNKITLDELIKATIGVHHGQALEDLNKALSLSPDELIEKAGGLTQQTIEKILSGTGLEDSWDTLREKLGKILEKWDNVGENGAATIWRFLDQHAENAANIDLDQLKDQLSQLADPNQTNAKTVLEGLLEKTDFDNSDIGQLISAVTGDGDALFALIDDGIFHELQHKLQSLLDLLNLGEQLTKFHRVISEELKLDQIKKAVEMDAGQLSEWMKNKVTSFLTDGDNRLMAKVREVDAFIDKLNAQKEVIFEQTRKALQKEYGASLAFSYQKSNERTALLDARFQLGVGTASLSVFQETIGGEFNRLLSDPAPGIHLSKGVLTQGITKEKSVSLSLPFAQRNISKLNKAAASATFIDEEDGRLMVFEVEATESIRRSRRYVQTVLNGYYSLKKKEKNITQKDRSLSLSFESKLARKRYKIKSLKQVLVPFIEDHLMNNFIHQGNNATGQVDQWINDMAYQIDQVKPNGKRNFGRTLVNLEIKVPPSVGEAWFQLPDEAHDYDDLYETIQQQMRKTVYHYFIESEDALNQHFRDDLYGVLLYEAFPVIEALETKRNGQVKGHWRNSSRNKALQTQQLPILIKLVTRLAELRERVATDHVEENIPSDLVNPETTAKNILSKALGEGSQGALSLRLTAFHAAEARMINQVIKAGMALRKFIDNAGSNVEALDDLRSFETELVKAISGFKINLSSVVKDYSRYLGTELFVAIAASIDPAIKNETVGLLEMTVLREDANFRAKDYLQGKTPSKEDILLPVKIIQVG